MGNKFGTKLYLGKMKAPFLPFNKDNCMLLTFDNNNLLELARDDCEQMKIAGKAFGINFELPQLQRINNINNMNKTELIHELQKIDYNHGKKMIIVV